MSYDSAETWFVVKRNILLVSYSFERTGKLLEERELRKLSKHRAQAYSVSARESELFSESRPFALDTN